MYNPDFIAFFSVSECEQMWDQSMLVLYFAFCGRQQCGKFICAFTLSPVPSRKPPMPWEFQL